MPAMILVLKIATEIGSDFFDDTYYHKPQNGFLLLELRTLNINILLNDINALIMIFPQMDTFSVIFLLSAVVILFLMLVALYMVGVTLLFFNNFRNAYEEIVNFHFVDFNGKKNQAPFMFSETKSNLSGKERFYSCK